MSVYYNLPGIGLSKFADGTSVDDAFKIAGIELPKEPAEYHTWGSIKRGAGQMAEGVGSALEDVAPETGEAVRKWGRERVENNPAAYPSVSDIHGVGSALMYGVERGAETLPMVAGGLAAGAVNPAAGAALMGGTMGAQTYGDVRQRQRETGNDNIPAALGAGAFAGVLGSVGGVGGSMVRGEAANLLTATAKSAGEQALMNPAIAAASRAASGDSLTDADAMWDYANQAVSGLAVGGAFGLTGHALAGKLGKRDLLQPTPESEAAPDADTSVNRSLDRDLFGNTPEDNQPIGPQAPARPAVPSVEDLAGLQAERSRLSRAMADAADANNISDYYKFQGALGQVDAALAHPAMQDLARGQQRAAANMADQQRELPQTPPPRPTPPPQLQLPSPDKFRPPLYGDAQGNIGRTPDLRSEALAQSPEGTQGDLFRVNPDQQQAPAPPLSGGSQPTPLTGAGQPSLFGLKPTVSVRSDFGMREILTRLRLASDYKGSRTPTGKTPTETAKGFTQKADAFTIKLANGIAAHLKNDNPIGANRLLDAVHEGLENANVSGKTVKERLAVLTAGRNIVKDFSARMTDAYAQEAKQRGDVTGAQVTQPSASADDAVAQMQAKNAADTQASQAAHAQQQREAQMAQAAQTVSDAHRHAIVQKALADPIERNHAERIADTLKRNGLDPELRPHEQEAVDRIQELQQQRQDAIEAFSKPDMIPGAGNEPIFEHTAQEGGAPGEGGNAPRATNTTRGTYGPEGFRLELQSEEGNQAIEAARARREAREARNAPPPEPAPPPDTRQQEMFTPGTQSGKGGTARVRKAVDNTVDRDPNSPANFKLQRQRPEDIHEPAPEPAPQEGLSYTPSNKQGEMFTPTGRVKKSVDQSPPKVETRGDQIKRAVAERRQERANATEARQEPQGDRGEHSGVGEERQTAEAVGGDRAQEGREGQAQGQVTYDSVLQDAQSYLARDGESGLLKPREYQQLSVLAEQGNVSPEKLQDMLNAAVDRNSQGAMADASGTRIKRQASTDTTERPEFTWYEMGMAADRLRKRLDQLGLHDAGVVISHNLLQTKEGPANAVYSATRRMITVAMNGARDMYQALNHEVVHHLREIGVLKDPEFDPVVNALRRNTALADHIDDVYKNLSPAERNEELFAEGYAKWAGGDRSVFQATGLFNKLKSFFDAIRQAFGARNPEDIFRSIESGEMGTRDRVTGSFSSQDIKARSAAIDKLPESLKPVAHGILDTLSDFKDRAISRVAFTEDLAARAKQIVPSAIKYVKDMTAKAQEYRGHEADYQKTLDSFQALKPELQKVGDGTVNGVIQAMNNEKKWGFEPEFLTKRTTNPLSVAVDPAMAAKFNALPKEAQDVVKEVFRKNHEMLQLQKEAASAGTAGVYDAVIKKAEADGKPKALIDALRADRDMAAGEFQKLFDIQEAEPYNPQRRYGAFVAFAKSKELKDAEAAGDTKRVTALKAQEDHYFMRQYDTKAAAQAVVRELRKMPQFDNVLDARETDQSTDHLVGARNMMLAFQQLRNFIKDQVPEGEMDPKVLHGINKLAADLYIRSLRQASSRKSELRRIGVGGGDMDQMKAFITQGRAAAHFVASMKHNDTILDTISKMRDEAKGSPDSNAMTIFNELMRRHAGGMIYDPAPFANKVKGFTGAYMIISSPAFYLEQVMQPALLSTPFMAGRHGYTTAVNAMGKAYKDTAKLWSGAGHGQLDTSKIADANVRNAINELSDRGIINVGQHMELGSTSALDNSGLIGNASKVVKFFSDLTSKLEAVNRVSTGIAAYKLERTKLLAEGKAADAAHAGAVDYAHKVIYDTHGDYSSFNAPRFMRGGVMGVVTQFRKFSIMQASLLAKLASGSLQGADPMEKAAARKALAFTVAHAAILGGAMALPGMATAKWLINKFFTDDNEPFDMEDKLRKWIGDEAISNILLKGVPTLGTHGVDISDRVGLGTATSVFPFLKDEPGTSYVDTAKSALLSLLGPTFGSIVPQWADGLDLMHQWDYWKGLEKFLPKGAANVSKALRESEQGVTNRRADQLMKPEDISFGHSFATALGIPTAAEAERLRGSGVENTKEQFFKDRTKRIVLEFTNARRVSDSAAMSDARERFMKLQDAKFAEGLPRSPMSTLANAAQNQRLRERSTVSGVQYKPRSPGLRQAREEAEED
jgi:hypothetical protein